MLHLSPLRTAPVALLIVVFLAACGSSASPTGSVACTEAEDGVVTITAAELAFDTSCLVVPAGEAFTIILVNDDSEPHNVAIYTDSSRGTQLFGGEIINGGETIEYDVEALEAGTFYFDCTVHPGMNGSVIAE